MLLINVTRGTIAGVLDTPLKLVTYKKLKNEKLQDHVNNNEKLVQQFFGELFSGGAIYREVKFLGGNFLGSNFPGDFFPGSPIFR